MTSVAEVRHVPQQYATIQAAIDAAAAGDTVLAAPGAYYENIRFRGKAIMVASQFILTESPEFIRSTIIDGSRPLHPDTASCVLFVNREDTASVLAGFTLTGGRGTRWLDEHGAGTYWEGGGVLSALASPTIRNNLIVNNQAVNGDRATSAGGGGLRCGDGAPRILNNVIIGNEAMYGGGIVLNFCAGAVVRNNVLTQNRVWQVVSGRSTYGGGGLWINDILPGARTVSVIENNTITGNAAAGTATTPVAGRAGALLVWNNANVNARNNIIWGNSQEIATQIFVSSARLVVEYCDVQDSFDGTGNFSAYPAFADSAFYLDVTSPCIDAGDPEVRFNDPASQGTAQWPSQGGARNDLGAYGGPLRQVLAAFSRPAISTLATADFGNFLPGSISRLVLPISNLGASKLVITAAEIANNADAAITVPTVLPLTIRPAGLDSLNLQWAPQQNGALQDTLLLFHNDAQAGSPLKILLLGNANPTPRLELDEAQINLGDLDINTSRVDTAFYLYNRGTGPDTVECSIDYRGVRPPSAAVVTPARSRLDAGDSLLVTFTIFPARFEPPILALYSPKVIVLSTLGSTPSRFEKQIRFRLLGTVDVAAERGSPLHAFALHQNYPNPFNPNSTIHFDLPQADWVTLTLYDARGVVVTTLLSAHLSSGNHIIEFDATGLVSGIYWYVLRTSRQLAQRKMMLLK